MRTKSSVLIRFWPYHEKYILSHCFFLLFLWHAIGSHLNVLGLFERSWFRTSHSIHLLSIKFLAFWVVVVVHFIVKYIGKCSYAAALFLFDPKVTHGFSFSSICFSFSFTRWHIIRVLKGFRGKKIKERWKNTNELLWFLSTL